MARNVLEIVNSALTKIGASPIGDLNEDSKSATLCRLRFEPCKRYVLRRHPWKCATDRVTLSPDATPPAFEYSNRFTLPPQLLRVLTVNDTKADYKIESGFLLSNDTTVDLRFVWDVDDVTLFDPTLDEAIACYLAFDICYNLTQSAALKQLLDKDFQVALKAAKTANGQESFPDQVEADYFLDARLRDIDPAQPQRDWPAAGYQL